MKSTAQSGKVKSAKPGNRVEHSPGSPVRQHTAAFEREKNILLALSNDITRVREKNDLIRIFASNLKEYFYFTHAVISLIDQQNGIYYPFLLDRSSMQIRHRSELPSLLKMQFSVNDPFIGKVAHSEAPVSFMVDEIVNEPGIPAFLKVNYECGIQTAMIAKLKSKMETIGFVFIYSDRTDSFPDEFKNILQLIAPHLSNAVANIIINEEIVQREEEKSILLSLSGEIAALRSREDLLQVVNTRIKALFSVGEFGIAHLNEDGTTYRAFVLDVRDSLQRDTDFRQVTSEKYQATDPVFSSIMNVADPVLLDVNSLQQKTGVPAYVHFWKKVGLRWVLGMRMRAGGKNVGCTFLHLTVGQTEGIKVNLLKAVCAQLSVAVSNILANEQISRKHEEQTFLLEFSNDIAQVRTKSELQEAIFKVLDKTMHIQLAMIRVIEDDGFHLSPFMFDTTLFQKAKINFEDLLSQRITIEEPYTARVLASTEGLVFNVGEEAKSGSAYARLWKTTGLRNMYGLPLRVGSKDIGTIWLMADRLSNRILKGICAQISVAIDNILANEKLLTYKKRLEEENDYLKEQIETIYNFSEIVGDGEQMQKVYRLMSLVADTNTTVLVLGETGTGKELIARAVHNASPRKDKLMVKVNCAALPANLVESELFGHERGAFTGAIDRRIGKFELANHSTLFLDEVGELTLEAQAKLLRVIQERELERLGGKQTIKVDVRLIAATNRDLEAEIQAGRFRADLYFRLNVFPIHIPPLRERPEDIEPLTHFFVQKYCRNTGKKIRKVAPAVIQQFRSYTWPGNIRELEHLVERSILLTTDGVLQDVFIPEHSDTDKLEPAYLANRSLEEVERSYLIEILRRCGGKISGNGSASEILKIPGNTLHSKIKKLGISKADYFTP